MKVEELKEKARHHELREEWQKAFDLYGVAIQIHDEEETPDITLFNRVGDIQTRLGQNNGAVEHYEKAINLYLEAELPNNAIAICKKVLRNLPDRNIFFLRMGQIRAGQGFLPDARQNFLAYAERQTARGDIESALNALIEFVDLSPEDVDIRQSLAAQLESHGRTGEAIEQYTEAYRWLISTDEGEEAKRVLETLEELAPDFVLPDPESIRAEDAVPDMGELVLESTSLGGSELDEWAGDESAGFGGVVGGLRDTDVGDDGEEEFEVEGEGGGVGEDLGFGEVETDELGSLLDGEEGTKVLSTFDFGSEDGAEDAEVVPRFGSGEIEAGDLEVGDVKADDDSLPFIDFPDDEGEDAKEESLPFLGFQDVDELEAEDEDEDALPLLGMEEEEEDLVDELPIEAALEDAALEAAREELEEPEAALEDAAFEAAREELEEPEAAHLELVEPGAAAPPGDHKEAAERGDLGLAIELVKALIEGEPDNVDLHQRLVEYAFRKNDQEILVSAYMELAGCLARTGVPLKAEAVYQQVLSLSPGHDGATAGIRGLDAIPGAGPPAQVASSEEYVDLGSMVFGDEAEKTTRWRVAAEAPSGDDEADFAKMLGQFKEKVSEHLAADDVAAHHDLGTAYMEMGLFEEAVAEFQMALRAAPNHLPTHEVMGRCWMKMGNSNMAVRALNRALNVPYEVEDDLIGIYYFMGRAQEDQGNNAQALEFYEKVFSLDINFEDVTERLRALR